MTVGPLLAVCLLILNNGARTEAFVSRCRLVSFRTNQRPYSLLHDQKNSETEWTSDFDDFVGEDDDSYDFAKLFQQRVGPSDYTACQTRQFSLGTDLIVANYVGNMGFDEVTDWEYYYPNEDDPNERKVVQPNPFDSSKPKRTRTSSGSVVRVFRGEFVGQIGGLLGAQGLDRRVLIKEFTGVLALQLARSELESVGKLQSDLVAGQMDDAQKGEWIQTAASRSIMARQDNANVVKLVRMLSQAPFLGVIGEVNLAELDGNLNPNDFSRELGVAPPKSEAIWVVYEYAGLSTIQAYAEPAMVRRAKLPPKRGLFGNIMEPPSLPPWNDRANYIVNGIMKRAIEAAASLHEGGVVHRSIGKSSIILSSTAMDKTQAVSPFATLSSSRLQVKLSDFGFSGLYKEAASNEEFCARARAFGLSFREGENSIATTNFAIAEDMHALGFVFMALLLTSLAEVPDPNYQMPATDEDTLQRLFAEIFDKNVDQFREYVEAEEIWSNLVKLLDEQDSAGWKVLETLLLAREKAARSKDTVQIFTIRGLLSNPFFKQ